MADLAEDRPVGPRSNPSTPPSVESLLADPSVSRTLKTVLDAWLRRDPVDAANDAELLADVLGRRVDLMLREAT